MKLTVRLERFRELLDNLDSRFTEELEEVYQTAYNLGANEVTMELNVAQYILKHQRQQNVDDGRPNS